VAKFSHTLAGAAMEGIERATIDQGRSAVLEEDSLRWAIYSGIAAHLADEIEKKQDRRASPQPGCSIGCGDR
jgi:hypothetical protein